MKLSLARLTFFVWLAWLLTLAIMTSLSFSRVLHPSFIYMAVPLGVQLICTLAILLGGLWRILRGPGRIIAMVLLFIGLMPAFWMAAYLEYLLIFASGRSHSLNMLVRSGVSASSLLGEPFVRIYYPYRYEGERFVMFSDSPKHDEKQMAAMDEHIRAMEKSLGSRSDYKAYWVRGPVYGIVGRYVCGWSLASPANTPVNQDGLNYVDRHEIAHFVLDQLLPRTDLVPALFHEGWAEVNSGPAELESDKKRALSALRTRNLSSIRDLTAPYWYYTADGPIYPQGAVLVDYLLRHYGHAKFLELCRSCRPETFPEDVQRVLGVNLDTLDEDYQEDLVKQEKPTPSDKEYLLSMKLGDKVSPEKWGQFVGKYCAGVERLRAAYRQSSVKLASIMENVFDDATGKEITTKDVVQYDNDNQCQACSSIYAATNGITYTNLTVFTPELEFRLAKRTPENSWQLLNYKTITDRMRSFCVLDNRDQDQDEYLWIPLRLLSGRSNGCTYQTKITDIESDSRLMRVHFETSIYPSGAISGRGWWEVNPEHNYALTEEQWNNFDAQGTPTGSGHVTVEYEVIEGNPVLKTARSDYKIPNQTSQPRILKLESCKFGPSPAKTFELSTYGDFNPSDIKTIAELQPSARIGILTWVASGWTALGLFMALGTVLLNTRRSAKKEENTKEQIA